MIINYFFRKKVFVFVTLIGFLFGLFIGGFFGVYAFEKPLEKLNSYDHISEEQINIYDDYVVVSFDEKELRWSKFEDSNSMHPFLVKGYNGLEIVPKSVEEIHVGDVISFNYKDAIYAHRVIEVDYDDEGWYAITMGDNNLYVDAGKRRFENIEGLFVGIFF
jgi:hypothetical protein